MLSAHLMLVLAVALLLALVAGAYFMATLISRRTISITVVAAKRTAPPSEVEVESRRRLADKDWKRAQVTVRERASGAP